MKTSSSIRDRKTATTDHEILDLFTRRWSPRAFSDRPVEPEKIRRMLEAARWTMSSYNEQPWRYVVASRSEDEEAYDQLLTCLSDGNQEWAKTAPVLMMSFYRTTFSRNGRENRCASHDLGAASAALTFQATAMGLYVHQMAGIKKEAARAAYDVPQVYEPMAGLAVGYLGDPHMLSEKRRSSEVATRTRQPMRQFVFGESWDEPADLITDRGQSS